MNNLNLIVLLIVAIFSMELEAQSLTSSPYSMYGLGQYETGGNGKNVSMGELGIGMPSDDHINLINPASLADMKNEAFFLDMGVELRHSIFQSGSRSENVTEGNINRVAMGFKLKDTWGLAFGILPVTYTGYKIMTQQYIEGTTQTEDVTFEGKGGISKFFISNGWQVTPAVSIGATASLLFGNINQDELQNTVTVNQTTNMRSFYLEGGFQFKEQISEVMPLTIGLIYGYSNRIRKKNEMIVYGSEGTTVIYQETLPITYGYLPQYYGLGLYSGYSENWQFGVDFLRQDWSDNNSGNSSIVFTDVKKLNAGLQFVPKPRTGIRLVERVRYRAGFSLENSYLKASGQNPLIYKVTAGFGVPLKSNTMLNVAAVWEDDSMSGRNNTIHTSSFRFVLGFAFSEVWFMKRQFE
jgi:hypothetical protein